MRAPVRLAAMLAAGLAIPYAPAAADPVADAWVPGLRKALIQPAATTTTTATIVDVRVAWDNAAGPGLKSYYFGDTPHSGMSVGQADGACFYIWPRDEFTVRHAWRYPGTYRLTSRVQMDPDECSLPGQNTDDDGSATIVVKPGKTPSNGPLPLVLDPWHGNHAAFKISLGTGVADQDGYVHTVTIDWGDGSRKTVGRRPLSRCRDLPRYWPSTHPSDLDDPMNYADHTYPGAGTYTVTVTAASSGCNGRDTQTATATYTVVCDAARRECPDG